MPHELELMEIHARALFTHDERARLIRVNEPWGGGHAPRLFVGLTREGNLWRFRADLPTELIEELEALCAAEPACVEFDGVPRNTEAYVRLLESYAPVCGTEAGPAYHFEEYFEPSRPPLSVTEASAELLRGGFEELVEELPVCRPFVAVLEEGRAVSVCRSVRITREAHEAGVETLPDFRGKGYATDATAGWAQLVRSEGAMPLYSTSWENKASQAVAKKLRLKFYGIDFHIT